ncbi:hypothetical protein NDU88_001398 [Pleurodeles waltl]|uniref:Uncharacterized protein n=1 Tax=Pleurodeles waltl TaxID=8319 RepID=A0AAV7WMB3_PLEWA|nr:hypothetical protein NDU88_001398 [Pleurodeles waltl]
MSIIVLQRQISFMHENCVPLLRGSGLAEVFRAPDWPSAAQLSAVFVRGLAGARLVPAAFDLPRLGPLPRNESPIKADPKQCVTPSCKAIAACSTAHCNA